MGSEFKAIILSTWKIPCTLPGNCALCIFIVVIFVLFVSMQVVHLFNTFQWFVLVRIGYEGWCCKWTRIHASVLLAFQHMECLLLIYFCICYCCYKKKKCHNLWTCICTYVYITCSYPVSGWCTEAFSVRLSVSPTTFWHLSTRYKAQSLLPFIGISSYSYH